MIASFAHLRVTMGSQGTSSVTQLVMAQTWANALFAHWRLAPSALHRFVPAGVTLDTFDGAAWLGVTSFVVERARFRGLPAIPGLSTFAEVNVRTYVTDGDRPGVLFLSLDAASIVAVLGARAWFRLPYFFAVGTATWQRGGVSFESRRHAFRGPPARFAAQYQPQGPVHRPADDPLARWLTERYCLYTHANGRLRRAEIHHEPWPVQQAAAVILENSLTDALGLALPETPDLTHFAAGVDAVIWPPRVVPGRPTTA